MDGNIFYSKSTNLKVNLIQKHQVWDFKLTITKIIKASMGLTVPEHSKSWLLPQCRMLKVSASEGWRHISLKNQVRDFCWHQRKWHPALLRSNLLHKSHRLSVESLETFPLYPWADHNSTINLRGKCPEFTVTMVKECGRWYRFVQMVGTSLKKEWCLT